MQWDIVMFSERRSSHGIIELHEGNFRHICFGSGTETFSAGVAILLHERHAKNVANAKVISDRVMYVDFTVGGKKLRSIAAYAPHAGYSADDFDAFFEQVHVAILGACKDGRQTIVGGDFNLQLQVGNRGEQIDALAKAFGFTIANDDEHHSPAAETWTFCSSMGVKRRIDFILCSSSLPLAASHPSCLLDLGSDHRAVYARFQLGKACRNKVGSSGRAKRGWRPELDGTGKPTKYHQILSRSLQTPPEDLNSLESACKYAVSKTSRTCTANTLQQQFHDDYFQSLLAERRATACRHRRAEISKTIRKEIRRKLRRQRAQRIESVLEEFVSLNRLQTFVRMPVQSKSPNCETQKPNAEEFAHFLGDIFASDTGFNSDERRTLLEETSANGLPDVEPFTILELQVVLKEMRRNKCADTSGLVAECFIYGNLDLHKCLLDVFNNMLAVGRFDASWSHTVFTMLPKGGNLFSPSNWRPIAVLKITYKIFAKLVYKRLRPTLERHQSKDQVGFRPCTSVEDAFVVLESVCSKSLEWNFPVWFASLDLKKAFDRIEYSSLFGALQSQGVSRPYLKLLAALYCNQTGDVNGKTFPIQRGVKQGDVISPLLFNAGLEHAMRKWKHRLQHCGFDLGNGEILTNVRYADDLMLYAKHCDELVFMMELLIEELSAVGLHLNTSKTKILTTTALADRMFLDVGGDMIEVVHGQETHKYLGKKLPGDLSARATVDVKHRIYIAWMKFHQHKETLLNRHVSLKLRLKFFDSIISPAILFGLTTVPLSAAQLSKLDIVRRRMLRSIVGWDPVVNGDWHDAMSRMNQKLQNAYRIYPTTSWPERILRGKFRFAAKIACKVNH